MKVRTTLEVGAETLYDETTTVDEARAAMDAALASVPESATGAVTLRSVATIRHETGVTMDLASMRENKLLAKAWGGMPAVIEAKIRRVAKRCEP